ncbi:hypothetical protein [Ahniella affigens]|nr:hypothetical protein [Ahniella affigens]
MNHAMCPAINRSLLGQASFGRISVLLFVLTLAACAESPPPPEPTTAARDPNANALEGTVYDTQGKALRKANEVEQQVLDQAAAQRKAIDEAGG